MSLGGYKFAGKYCEKGSLTDVQWALRMHKTKVAAFMAANTLSGAGWDYDMTGSPDGNYHCLDSVGNNYVTVFKRTNGENDYTWFALYTLCKFTGTGTDSGAVKVDLVNNFVENANNYLGFYATCFYRIGTAQILYSDALNTTASSWLDATCLLPMGNLGAYSSNVGASSYPPSNSSTLRDESSAYFGYAIKGDSIVMFCGKGVGDVSCSIASGHAFYSFINSNDSKGILTYNTQQQIANASSFESATRNISTSALTSPMCCVQKYNGSMVYSGIMTAPFYAYYYGAIQSYPYQSIGIQGISNDISLTSGKGTVNIDLLSINFAFLSSSIPAIYSAVANGNYLTVNSVTSATITSSVLNRVTSPVGYGAMYVGWDPSNPDITQASSWQLYDGT